MQRRETGVKVQEEDSSDEEPGMECSDVVGAMAVFFSTLLFIFTLPFSLFFCFTVVSEYRRACIFRLGRLRSGRARGPGMFFVLPCIDDVNVIDLRTVTCIIEPQEILTKDSVSVIVDAVVYHRVQNPLHAVTKVHFYTNATKLLAAAILRTVLGTKNLSELLADREAIASTIKTILDHATDPWGVEVERVEIKDARLPPQLQRAMAAEAEAAREARAKIILAEGEKEASQSLKEASDIIMQSSLGLQLRYLQTLSDIATTNSSTIVFPIPFEMMQGFFESGEEL